MTAVAAPAPRFYDASTSVASILGAEALPGHLAPHRPALIWDGHSRTYAELRERALRLAHALRERGVKAGDRVAGHLLNRGETFELYFACAYAGVTFVSLNWRLTARELAFIVDDCTPAIVFTQGSVSPAMLEVTRPRGVPTLVIGDDAAGPEYDEMATGPMLSGPFARCEPHLILYTSGTTGTPKGVMMSHRNITWFAFQQIALYCPLGRDAVTLVVSPTFNTAAINEQSIPTFLAGGTVAVHPSRRWSARRMADYVDRVGATHTIIYPSMMEPFMEEDRRSGVGLESLRVVATGGENCPPATLARFQRRWPRAELFLGYGSTESGIVSMLTGSEIGRHPGSVGRPALGMAIQIRDADGAEVAAGAVGEIWAGGDSVIPGYWNAPELTAQVIRHGWLNVGDLGRQDPDGYIYLEGRSRDVIISKGQNIYPAEVENVLSEHEDLLDSAVLGLPDPEWGEVVCAAIVLKPGRTRAEQEISAFVRERVASYKRPRHIVFVDHLPRNSGNKVVKAELAAAVAARLDRDVE